MSVKIRLRRVGAKKQPAYRIVVADSRAPRDGRIIENIGYYNPLTHPSTVVISDERYQYWVSKGALPTDVIVRLLKQLAAGPAVVAEVPVVEVAAPVVAEVPAVEVAAPIVVEEAPVADEGAPITIQAVIADALVEDTSEEAPATEEAETEFPVEEEKSAAE